MSIETGIANLIKRLNADLESEIVFRECDEDGYIPHEVDRFRSIEREYTKRRFIRELEQILNKYQ